jgi:hypothetical protein
MGCPCNSKRKTKSNLPPNKSTIDSTMLQFKNLTNEDTVNIVEKQDVTNKEDETGDGLSAGLIATIVLGCLLGLLLLILFFLYMRKIYSLSEKTKKNYSFSANGISNKLN